MTERWVKATVQATNGEHWISMMPGMIVRPSEGGSVLFWPGEDEGVTFKEPPEYFLPWTDYGNMRARQFLERVGTIPPDQADGAGLVREAKRIIEDVKRTREYRG